MAQRKTEKIVEKLWKKERNSLEKLKKTGRGKIKIKNKMAKKKKLTVKL